MKKINYNLIAIAGIVLTLLLSGCQKLKYNTIKQSAYLRVFNDLNYQLTLANKDQPLPFLTMLIDPVVNAAGTVTSASTIGDFLDVRIGYAPPYPAHAGNTGFHNVEYPGQENVLVGPILNGIDLSSWAQVPSGKHHFMFVSRPINSTPFLSLDPNARKSVLVDTNVTFNAGQVYTMEALLPTVASNKVALYVRNEQFTNLSFSDSSVYVNFYNLSSKGYWQKNYHYQPASSNTYVPAIKDTMNVYLSLLYPDSIFVDPIYNYQAIKGYSGIYFTSLYRFTDNSVSAYRSFPVFTDSVSNHITTKAYEYFQFFSPGNSPQLNNPNLETISYPDYQSLACYWTDYTNGKTPNLIVSTPSGPYNPRSFGTINTIELINGFTYLMSVQRKYDAPVIH